MCEFCLKHGEGKKWYLEAGNYSEDLLSDLRRRKFFQDFGKEIDRVGPDMSKRLSDLDKVPKLVRRYIRWKMVRTMKRDHYGQIVPIEDVERIFAFVNSIIRIACLCRHITLGEEKRYCYGISMGPDGGRMLEIMQGIDSSFFNGPITSDAEVVTKEEALSQFREYEKEGLCHSVWTFKTPFIGGICNCDRPDCLAMQMSVTHDIPMMFRGEYVAANDPELCVGCRQCMKVCQFGAIGFSAARKKSFIDPHRCYGCGICRSVCSQDAIRLRDREEVPVAAGLW